MPTVSLNNRQIHYLEKGTGLPIVLLHAFPLNSRMWSAQLNELASVGRIITPDFAGFGQSSPFDDTLSVDILADDLHALLSHLKAMPCVLGGISMGGYVAMAFARRHASSLKGLMLFNTRMDADAEQTRESRNRNIELVRAQGPSAIADAMISRLLSPGAASGRPDLVKSLRQMIEATPGRSIEQALAALRDRPDSTEVLQTLAVPRLVVVGDADQLTPLALAEAMHRTSKESKLVVISGAGHLSPIEQPAQVSRAIRQFVSRIDS